MTLIEVLIEYSRILQNEGTIEGKRFSRNVVREELHDDIINSFNNSGDPIDFDGTKITAMLGIKF